MVCGSQWFESEKNRAEETIKFTDRKFINIWAAVALQWEEGYRSGLCIY